MKKFTKICYTIAFIGALASGIMHLQDSWHSYIWQFIAAIWIANSYLLELKVKETVL